MSELPTGRGNDAVEQVLRWRWRLGLGCRDLGHRFGLAHGLDTPGAGGIEPGTPRNLVVGMVEGSDDDGSERCIYGQPTPPSQCTQAIKITLIHAYREPA